MSEKKTFRLVLSIFLCLATCYSFAQNEWKEEPTNIIDIDLSGSIDNQFKADNERFTADANIGSDSRIVFPPRIAIKTNLLYWSGVMPNFKHYSFLPNLEVEWFIKGNWSIVFNGAYSKWGAGNDKFFGVSSWSLEPRYWLGKFKYIDVYTGVYLQAGDYDNQNLHIDEFGNTGTFYGAGLSVGAYIPLKKQWGIEIGFRTGYEHIRTDFYSQESQYYYRDYTKDKNRWRITGINASISYRFWDKTKQKGAK